MPIEPLAVVPVTPLTAMLPKADLHIHQEATARLESLAALRKNRLAYDWTSWSKRVLAENVPGLGRLAAIYEPDKKFDLTDVPDSDADVFVARVAATLEEGAADGAVLIELRFG